MDVQGQRLDPMTYEPGHGFVFRDFEESKLNLIRAAVDKAPVFYSLCYFLIALFWTVLMSQGAALDGENSFAVNITPHVSHYTLIIGLIIYPLRRIALPVAAYAVVFLVPFLLPHPGLGRWIDLPGLTFQMVAGLFLLHLTCGIVIGLATRAVAFGVHRLISPFKADLFTCVAIFVLFLAVTAAQAQLTAAWGAGLPADLQLQLGFSADVLPRVGERLLRGSVVAAAFLLAVLEMPDRREAAFGLAAALAFPALALAQSAGFVMYPMLDTGMMALLITLMLPVPVAILACITGFPIYVAMTGQFVAHTYEITAESRWLETYSILLLMMIALTLALRALNRHAQTNGSAITRRLSMVEDFADVGLLSVNLDQQHFRASGATQRILGLGREGRAQSFLDLFDGTDRNDLAAALAVGAERPTTLLLRRKADPASGARQVLRMCLWFETAASGARVAYGLVLDVTVEHQQERALKDTLAELSSKQERQRQLFSIISHELRTPASVVSMLVDELDDPQNLPKVRTQLRDVTQHLLSTLADMRQTVNPTQNLPVKLVPYAAADLAESVRNMFAAQAKEHGTAIKLILGSDAQQMRLGDVVRVRQALSNLVRNAIIHSGSQEICLHFHSRTSAASQRPLSIWKVTDNGVGIPETEVARLFEPFERGGHDPRSQADGSGLGLYIAKSSIETLGGRIAHFRPEGGGTGYVIELPEAVVPKTEALEPKDQITPRQSFPGLHVLLAEDNKLVAEVTQTQLARFVGRVEVVDNGRDALARISESQPDLLITDLFMPEMDGDELVRSLRDKGYDLPIIGLTAAVVGEDMERLTAAGADAVMTKPLDMVQLRRIIAQLHPQAEVA